MGFSGVFFLLFGRGRIDFFCCWGRGPGPAQTAKKNAPAQTAKKKNATAPSERVFFVCCLGGWRFFFCCLGGGRVLFFAVWAGACFFFGCLGGGVFFFLLFGPGACFFVAVWAADGSSLTYPSAWLVFKRPNNKRDRTAKKNTGSGLGLTVCK